MENSLKALALRARSVAKHADAAAAGDAESMSELLKAMMAYRAAAVGYLAHPSVGDYVRFDAAKYEGETREALERIAELIDHLNNPREDLPPTPAEELSPSLDER